MVAHLHSVHSFDRFVYAHRVGPAAVDQNKPQTCQQLEIRVISYVIFEVRLLLKLRVEQVHEELSVDSQQYSNESPNHSVYLLSVDLDFVEIVVNYEDEEGARVVDGEDN